VSQQSLPRAPAPSGQQNRTLPLAIALISVYVFWGSTYLAMRYAVETLPPYLLAAVRFLVSGGILMVVALALGATMPRAIHWRTAWVTGLFLLLGGNCTVLWSSQVLPSSVVALLIGVTPLYATVLEWLWLKRGRPTTTTWVALAAGFGGVVVLTSGAGKPGSPLDPVRVGAVLLAALSWTVGSLWSRDAPQAPSPLMNAAAQMLAGGAAVAVVSGLHGEWSTIRYESVSARSVWSLLYLIVFGSLVGFTAYIYTLKHTSAAVATSYAFVNPLVAVALGAGFGGEALDWRVGVATALIVGAVAALTLMDRKGKNAPRAEEIVDGEIAPETIPRR
jgi:drug/metabolite transporter (DMT)-like permease